MDEETRKDDKLMERKYKGRAEEKMMLGADGQRAGGKSYWWLLHLRSASESYKHSSAECSTQPYHCSTLTLRVQLHVCPPNRCICNFFYVTDYCILHLEVIWIVQSFSSFIYNIIDYYPYAFHIIFIFI